LHNLKHNKILHERVLLLTVITEDVPVVESARRLLVEKLPANFWRITGRYGFTEEPDIPELLSLGELEGRKVDLNDATFFLSRETIVPSPRPGMAIWRERLFALMSRNAQSATAFFHLPANRVVELGMQVQV
jgi:KUP system potassium uptake protein